MPETLRETSKVSSRSGATKYYDPYTGQTMVAEVAQACDALSELAEPDETQRALYTALLAISRRIV